ncbi:uncharacterized protein METZ01_LOCUS468977, partial [marine metagenome]
PLATITGLSMVPTVPVLWHVLLSILKTTIVKNLRV